MMFRRPTNATDFFTNNICDQLRIDIKKELQGNNTNSNWGISSSRNGNVSSIIFYMQTFSTGIFAFSQLGPRIEMAQLELEENENNTVNLRRLTLNSSAEKHRNTINELINDAIRTFNQSLRNSIDLPYKDTNILVYK